MDEEQVEYVQAQLLHAAVEGGKRRVVAVLAVGELGRDEQLVPRHVALSDRSADTFLVPVALRGVDQPIPGLDRFGNGLLSFLRRDEEDPETNLRDLQAVVHP